MNLSSNLKHHVQLWILKLLSHKHLQNSHTFERALDINLSQMITKETGLQPVYISMGLGDICEMVFQPHGDYWRNWSCKELCKSKEDTICWKKKVRKRIFLNEGWEQLSVDLRSKCWECSHKLHWFRKVVILGSPLGSAFSLAMGSLLDFQYLAWNFSYWVGLSYN